MCLYLSFILVPWSFKPDSHVSTTLEEESQKGGNHKKAKFCNDNGPRHSSFKTTQAEKGGESSFHRLAEFQGDERTNFSDPGEISIFQS